MMWSQQRRISLIEDLEKSPCLWDTQNMDYRNPAVKSESLAHLANKYEVDTVEMDKKIQALKSQFRREHKKVLDSQKSGSSLKAVWFGYDRMRFLLSDHDTKGSCTSDTNESAMYEENENHRCDKSEDVKPENGNDNSCYSSPNEQSEMLKSETLQSALKRKEFLSPLESQKKKTLYNNGMGAFECLTALTENVLKRDEYSIYGEHVGNKLRNSCRSRLEVVIAQNEIDNICFKLTMGGFADLAQSYQQAALSNQEPDPPSDIVQESSMQPNVSLQSSVGSQSHQQATLPNHDEGNDEIMPHSPLQSSISLPTTMEQSYKQATGSNHEHDTNDIMPQSPLQSNVSLQTPMEESCQQATGSIHEPDDTDDIIVQSQTSCSLNHFPSTSECNGFESF